MELSRIEIGVMSSPVLGNYVLAELTKYDEFANSAELTRYELH